VSVVIYMPVENEGPDCWRPVHADHVAGDVYEITVLKEPRRGGYRRDQTFAAESMCSRTASAGLSPMS
jgi:hypothetical protein